AEAALEVGVRDLSALTITLAPIVESLREIELQDRDLARAVRRALASARARRHLFRRRLEGDQGLAVPPAIPFPTTEISAFEIGVRQYAANLQTAAAGPERTALETEAEELTDRQVLCTHLDSVKAELARLEALWFLDTCISETTTNT